MPRLTPLAAGLPATVPFVSPEQTERDRGRVFTSRLGANENGFGPSPLAVQAMQGAAAQMWKYGDSANHDLRHALAAHHGVRPENITVGEGIDGLLGNLVRLTIAAGDRVVTSLGAYPTLNYHVTGFGGVIEAVPYRNDHEDPSALVAKARDVGARLVYIANPDNPMGTWHQAGVIEQMLDDLPDDALLVLDEAYIELAPPGTAPNIDANDPRVIRLRTFSKAYGLAGLRVGYAIGPTDLITAFDRVRNHFGVNRMGQIAALAALQDHAHLTHVQNNVARSRDRIAAITAENGLCALPSATNFVAVDCGQNGDYTRAVLAQMLDAGVFLRMPAVAPMDRCLRVSCGTDADMDLLAAALPAALNPR